VPKSLTFKSSSITHWIGVRPILRCLGSLRCWGSLWKGREWILWLRNGVETPLVKRLVPIEWFLVLGFKGLPCLLLLLYLVCKHANIIKGRVCLQFHHIRVPRINTSQVSNYNLLFGFLDVTLD